MNVIGSNVAKALKYYKIDKSNLIVIHDDLEQKLGKFRIVKGTSFKYLLAITNIEDTMV